MCEWKFWMGISEHNPCAILTLSMCGDLRYVTCMFKNFLWYTQSCFCILGKEGIHCIVLRKKSVFVYQSNTLITFPFSFFKKTASNNSSSSFPLDRSRSGLQEMMIFNTHALWQIMILIKRIPMLAFKSVPKLWHWERNWLNTLVAAMLKNTLMSTFHRIDPTCRRKKKFH